MLEILRLVPAWRPLTHEKLNPGTPTGDTFKLQGVTITESDWAVICHESAHVVLAHRLGLLVKWVDLTWQDGGLNGYTFIVEGRKLSDYLVCLLAGETAEVECLGRQILGRTHAGSDRELLYRLVVRHGSAGEQAHFVAKQQVRRMVRQHRGVILEVAHGLLELVGQAQGADVTVETDDLSRMMGDDVAILKLAANDDQTRLLAATDVVSLKRAMNG